MIIIMIMMIKLQPYTQHNTVAGIIDHVWSQDYQVDLQIVTIMKMNNEITMVSIQSYYFNNIISNHGFI